MTDKIRQVPMPVMPSAKGIIDSGALSKIDTAHATLPAAYEQARDALAACDRIDECKNWADKMEALRSYAKQADDQTLFKFAVRIAARAIRRTGELLEMFRLPVGRPANSRGAPTNSQRAAARAAGLSKDQEVQAKRVAKVPQAEFDAMVDSDDPPTVTELAERGTKRTTRQAPPGFTDATELLGLLRQCSEFCATHDPRGVARGVMDYEVDRALDNVSDVKVWLSQFERAMEEGPEVRRAEKPGAMHRRRKRSRARPAASERDSA